MLFCNENTAYFSGAETPDRRGTQTFAFIAHKGAGKTYAAGKLIELLLEAGVQVAVLTRKTG